MLEIQLMGRPVVLVGGEDLVVDTRKAIALLAYLAIEGSATRDSLATLLWDEAAPDRARATLRRTLSALRGAAGPDVISADRNVVSLTTEVVTDSDRMRAELDATAGHGHDPFDVCPQCIPHLRLATDMYRGEFLEGFTVNASPEFEDWVRTTTESYRLRAGETFQRLATALAAEGDYSGAVGAVSRWIELDSLHEPAHRYLMLLHAWAGDRPGAIQAYRNFVAVLDHELGVPPLEETTELYEAILDEDLPPAPGARRRTRATGQPRSDDSSQLIDRETEMQTLHDVLSSTTQSGSIIALAGAAWMGKTRLLEELAAEAAGAGREVLIGRAFPMEQTLPYALVGQVLRAGQPHSEAHRHLIPLWALSELGRLLPEIGGDGGDLDADRYGEVRLLEAFQTVISILADQRPLLVMLDDVQWTDPASATAFAFLARRIADVPILLVVAARSGTPVPQAIAEVIQAADRSMTLLPLTTEQITPLAGDRRRAEAIREQTGGVPLLVREAVSSTSLGGETPSILRYLESRLREVGELGRQILTAAAVLDGTCDATLLRETSGRSEEEVVEAVEELVSAGLLRELPETDTLGFTLDALEGMVYESTSLVRRRLLHRRAARAMADRSRAASDPRLAGAIAAQYRAAGDPEAPVWYLTAGDLATAVYAYDSARDFYENALALGNPNIATIRLSLGELAMAAGDYERARQELTVAASQADPATIATIEHRIGEVERLLGRFTMAEEHFQRALDAGGESPEVLADWALLAHRTGDAAQALALAERARVAAEEKGDPRQMSRVHNILAAITSDRAAALEHVDEAIRLAGEDDLLRMAALNNHALLLSDESGDEAGAIVLEAISIAERTGHRHREAALWNQLADIHHRAGRETEAQDALTRSVSLLAEIDAGELEPELWLLSRW